MVIVGWATGNNVYFDFESFDVSILAGGVWATSVLMTSNADYFRGFVYLSLYLIIALALYLYKE